MTTEEMPWHIISAMFAHRSDHLVAHHIDSYNRFARSGIYEIIRRNNPLVVVRDHDPELNDYRYRCEVYIGGRDGSQLKFHRPTYMDQGVQHPLYPNVARLRNASYSVYVTQTAEVRIVTHIGGERKEEWQTFPDIGLMWLPIMLGGDHCYLQGLPRSMRASFGEGRNDPGGYFIIDGKEKVIVPQEKFADNTLYVRELNSDEYSFAVDVRSIAADPSKPQRNLSIRMVKGSTKQEGGQIVVKLPNVKQPMPLFTVMRALGLESDREIVEAILGVSPEYSRYQRVLIPSVHDAGRIYTAETAQAFIGTFTKGKGRTHALEILTDYLLPHMGEGVFKEKALYIGYMVLRMLRLYSGAEEPTDRDSFAMKRVELSGDLLFDLSREYYKLDAKAITTRIDKEFYYHENTYKDNLASLVRNNLKAFFSDRLLDAGVRKGFKGSWGAQAHTKKEGVVQSLNRLSFNSAISQLRKLNLPMEASAKVVGPRFLHGTQWGYIDPVDTPDGGNVGLHKHLAISTMVTPGADSTAAMKAIESHGLVRLIDATPTQRSNMPKLFLDGYWLGFVDAPEELVTRLHLLRLNNLIDILTSCSYDRLRNEVHVLVAPGRLTRPVLAVHDGRPVYTHTPQAKLIDSGKPTWTELTQGLSRSPVPSATNAQLLATAAPLAYIDTTETNSMLLAVSPKEFEPRHTGIEIHPSLILGVMGNQIVYPENNQLPRDLFFCGQGKQAVSIYSTAYESRIDKSALVLHGGQTPLVKSRYLNYINHEENPYGVNAIVAIMSYSGYNVEDAVLMNRGSVERGMFSTTYYSMYEGREESDKVAGTVISSQFMNTDDPAVLGRKAGYDYSGLDATGFLPVNTPIVEKQVVIGKAASNVQAPGEFIDQSIGTKKGATGIVDRVYISEGDDGFRIGKIRVREWREPAQGDKVCSRCGQKGTTGLLVDEEDMPFLANGLRPDIIINPHALPSRMTIGQLIESLAGSVGVEYGYSGDCTAFENKGEKVVEYGEMLARRGFSATGNQTLYDGQSGQQIESQIYIGPTYYMRLKHMTKDKINHRGRGPRTQLTRQPVQGRAKDGGLRIGEMERDGLLGHGMSRMLQQSMMERSDDYKLAVCNHTGTVAIYNEARDVFFSPYMDGPLSFERSEDNSLNNTSVQRHGTSFSIVHVPYSFKLLWQELMTMNIAIYVITDENVDRLTKPVPGRGPEEMKQMHKALIAKLKKTGDIKVQDRRERRRRRDDGAAVGVSSDYGAVPFDYGASAAPMFRPDAGYSAVDAPPPAPTSLPPGWSAHEDPASNDTYYYNEITGVTQWERPVDSASPYRPTSPTSPYRPTSPTSPYRPTSPTSPYRPTSPTSPYRPTSPAGPAPASPLGSPRWSPRSPQSDSEGFVYQPTSPQELYQPPVEGSLPAGWEAVYNPDTDAVTYANAEVGVVRATRPPGNPPPGWELQKNPATGLTEYYDPVTKIFRWSRPGLTPPSPARFSPRSPSLPPGSPRFSPRSPSLPPGSPRFSPRSPSLPPGSPRFSPRYSPRSPEMPPPGDTPAARPPRTYGPGTDYNPSSPTPFVEPTGSPTPPSPRGLPAGWEQVFDSKSGEVYYSNRELGRTQWEYPTTPGSATP